MRMNVQGKEMFTRYLACRGKEQVGGAQRKAEPECVTSRNQWKPLASPKLEDALTIPRTLQGIIQDAIASPLSQYLQRTIRSCHLLRPHSEADGLVHPCPWRNLECLHLESVIGQARNNIVPETDYLLQERNEEWYAQ
jgi:hypothetical protein